MSAGGTPQRRRGVRRIARRIATAAVGGMGLLALLAPVSVAAPGAAHPSRTARATIDAPDDGAGNPAADIPGSEPLPRAYLVADADTGAVITARDEHRAVLPASTIKLMTALVGLERLPLDATLQISPLVEAQPASKITMRAGEVWLMADALHALLMASANDAAYAIAENAAGSLEGFADAMQASATRMGLRDSTFNDPAGLDAEGEGFQGGSLASAFDLAVIARNALAVPAIASATARLEDYPFTGPDGAQRTIPNHNDTWLTTYPGATGLKAGYTERADRTFIASATRDGRTCIAVVLGIRDTLGWATRLTDQCFAVPVSGQDGSATLPPVRATTVEQRRAAVAGFPRTLGASAVGVAGAQVERGATTRADAGADPSESAGGATSSGSPETAATSARATTGSAPGPVSGRTITLAILVVLAVAFVSRRRQVKHQRRRRLARQKMLADARRSGVLRVLDPEAGPVGSSNVSVMHRTTRRPPSATIRPPRATSRPTRAGSPTRSRRPSGG